MNEDLLVSEASSKQQPSYTYYSAYPNLQDLPIVVPPASATLNSTAAPEVASPAPCGDEENVLADLKHPQEHPQFQRRLQAEKEGFASS